LDSAAGVGLKRQLAKKNLFAGALDDSLHESEQEDELDVLPELPAVAKIEGFSESTETVSSSSSRYSTSRPGFRQFFIAAVR
jgi:hypothetical protein